MSPGVNDHLRNTGTLPKSNRRSNRNRDRVSMNQWIDSASGPPSQHTNNLFQLDWHPVSERSSTSRRTVKNSNNTRYRPSPVSLAPSSSVGASCPVSSTSSAFDFSDLGFYNSFNHSFPNLFTPAAFTSWLKMTPPPDSRTQSPPNLPVKPTNTDKMPERSQVEGRLNQIRDYINVTSRMMESLSHSTDPRAQAQHEKLSKMVEDLYDSEQKLSKLLEDCEKYWNLNENNVMENGVSIREQELQKKVEESQQKLAQLQEHQAHLMGLQLHVRERLNEARQAQQDHQSMLANMQLNEDHIDEVEEQQDNDARATNVEQLERETEVLRNKLQQLENKKIRMDHLVQELQTVEMLERASCSSETSGQRDKVAELEAMKAQLSHLKALMNETTCSRDSASAEPEHDNGTVTEDIYQLEEIEPIENARGKSSEPPSIDQIMSVTRELKEQQQMLLAARAELQRLKHQQCGTSENHVSAASITSSTPPPTVFVEKKLSNNDARSAQNRRRQIEDFMRKDHPHGSSVSQNGHVEWNSRRGSNSQHSQPSTPGNIWPPPSINVVPGLPDHNGDNISVAENLLEVGSQTPMENGFSNNFWGMPNLNLNQPSQGATVGSAEYYRQLLLGSQSQQLQMMSTTIQQCCQLLWAQQREMQGMKTAIAQLQNQLRHAQSHPINNLNIHEDPPSNIGRPHYNPLDPSVSTLPPSSSLPNLVTLPANCSSPAPPINTSNCQPQPLQLNNQVPPGNRANNYWDNFRSYSRQNLLSGTSKTAADCIAGTMTHTSSAANSANGIIVSAHVNKCNRPQCMENLPTSSDDQYFLNLHSAQQQQSMQHPDREASCSSSTRNNYAMEFPSLNQSSQLLEIDGGNPCINLRDEDSSAKIAKKISKRDDLKLILMHCLKALKSRKTESPLPSSNVSNNNSSESSDDESEAGAAAPVIVARNTDNINVENPLPTIDCLEFATMILSENPTTSSSVTSSRAANNDELISNDHGVTDSLETAYDQISTNDDLQSVSDNEWKAGTGPIDNSEDLSTEVERANTDYVMLDREQNTPTTEFSLLSSQQRETITTQINGFLESNLEK